MAFLEFKLTHDYHVLCVVESMWGCTFLYCYKNICLYQIYKRISWLSNVAKLIEFSYTEIFLNGWNYKYVSSTKDEHVMRLHTKCLLLILYLYNTHYVACQKIIENTILTVMCNNVGQIVHNGVS